MGIVTKKKERRGWRVYCSMDNNFFQYIDTYLLFQRMDGWILFTRGEEHVEVFQAKNSWLCH